MPPTTDTPDPDAYDALVKALFARQPERMVPDLARITTLVELLGRPDQAYPAIQVTGTNGKTTTAHMITCLLAALGVNPGTYTSPHLHDVRERIMVGGEPIGREAVVETLTYLQPFLEEVDARHPERVSFFEVLTALAYTHFADAPVDVGVFEVGMGGRWDATNLVRGEVAVVGEVAVDHPELGGTVERVAGEKLGIVKQDAVAVSAAQPASVRTMVADVAAQRARRLIVAGVDFGVADRQLAVGGQRVTLRGVTGTFPDVYLPLHGPHQADNAALALAAVEAFLGFAGGLDTEIVREAFAAVRSPGRLEVVRRPDASPVVLDGAHNPEGARCLARALHEEFAYRHRVFVVGVLGDKDVEGIVSALLPVADHIVATQPRSGRAAPAERVAKAVRTAGGSVEVAPDVATALDLATGLAGEEDGVIVAGSLYTVAEARSSLGLDADAA
jgi:dihydrofolate synthase / folylpolyglutamate synthase